MMALIPRHKKPRFGSLNRCGKRNSKSQDIKNDSSGSNATIMYKCDRSGSNPMITDYNANYAPAFISQDPKHNSYGYNTAMICKRNRSSSDPMITEYTVKDAPAIVTINVNMNNIQSQGNSQSTNINDDDMV